MAFTMIELLVVIGVVVTLLGILVVAVGKAANTAQTTSTLALMNSMKVALHQFRGDIGYLPPVLGHPNPDFTLPPDNHDLRKLFDPRGVLPELVDGTANGAYAGNIQKWFSWTTLPDYLIGYGNHDQDGYGNVGDVDDGIWDYELPPIGLRDPGPDGVWEATVYGDQDGSLLSRMRRPNPSPNALSNIDRGKVYGPYLELKDDHLLASTDGTIDSAGRLNLFFPGDAGYDPLLPKVILDYWGHPIRYYRRLYAPGSLKSPYRPHGPDTLPPTLSDVFVLRPFEIEPGKAIDGLGDLSQASYLQGSGDPTTIAALNSAEFALFSTGPDGLINPDIRYDNPEDPGNDPYGNGPTSFANEDNIVELGP